MACAAANGIKLCERSRAQFTRLRGIGVPSDQYAKYGYAQALFGLEAVSVAANRNQQFRLVGVLLNLLAKKPHVATQRAPALPPVISPDFCKEILLRDRSTRAPRQRRKQSKLGRGERNGFVV